MDEGRDIELDYDYVTDNSAGIAPERELWSRVLMLTLEDLDGVCQYLYDDILPLQRDVIVKALRKDLVGREYWQNRSQRAMISKQKIKCKHELRLLLHCINSAWFNVVCDFCNFDQSYLRKIACKIVDRTLDRKLCKSNTEIREKLRPRKKRGRRKANIK